MTTKRILLDQRVRGAFPVYAVRIDTNITPDLGIVRKEGEGHWSASANIDGEWVRLSFSGTRKAATAWVLRMNGLEA